ncbi:MAG: 4-(cytidine 5'-diphospho)-2-C-methyl-D-erythritol kinase [Thiotrichales bacterium]
MALIERGFTSDLDHGWWAAPGKLNLFLHIVGRRADGYHELQTLFQILDRGDRLAFSCNDSGTVRRATDVAGVPEAHDLTVRAARVLQAEAGVTAGCEIHLNKRLPLGGGLGGGSSDAATVLLVLNELWGCRLPRETLSRLALALGADVPVFVAGHTAWGEGVGERLTPVVYPEAWYLVVKPPVEISTAALFAARELTRDCSPMKIAAFRDEGGINVFEPLVRQKFPTVDGVMHWLDRHAKARLTGTGACVFAKFETEYEAAALLGELPEGCRGFVAKGVSESPLMAQLRALRGR